VQWRIESHVLEAVESLIAKVELWEEVWDDGNDQEERLTQHQLICQQNIDELDAQIDELLQLALEQRNSRTRQLFSEKQKELENRREKYEEQLQVTQGRLQSLAQAADKRKTVERILEDLQKLGGIKKLPFEMQRKLLTQLVDEIVLDTKEQWFEIRGELTDTFCYASGQVVSISACKPLWQESLYPTYLLRQPPASLRNDLEYRHRQCR